MNGALIDPKDSSAAAEQGQGSSGHGLDSKTIIATEFTEQKLSNCSCITQHERMH
jgi:hypothetical protein